MEHDVKVRFAPSPTGPLHIGGVRTALYNYLFAKHFDGTFILRIEDTDQSRMVPGAEEYIKESLSWLGIMPDEGFDEEGPNKPYRQSDRKQIYRQYADQLLKEHKAYIAFDSPEDLEEMRNQFKSDHNPMPQYNYLTRKKMSNSLTMSDLEVKKRIKAGDPYVIRLMVPENHEIRFKDTIRGWVHVSSENIDDKILIKSDGLPTYHLANVVDDHLMGITHVIRGEEWLPSAPLHVLLYRSLNWGNEIPVFAHLPLILKPDGNGKLSKRDGEKLGFPVFPISWTPQGTREPTSGFREMGYLPEAMINFLAMLGWNPGTEQELFQLPELITAFTLDRVNKAGAKFDIEKAKWFNQQYIKLLPDNTLAASLSSQLKKAGIVAEEKYIKEVAIAFRERITFLYELLDNSSYFFQKPEEYDESIIYKKWNPDSEDFLIQYEQALQEQYGDFNSDIARKILQEILDRKNLKMGSVMQLLRVVLTGSGAGIDLMKTIEILGRKEVISRIRTGLDKFSGIY